jgi:hypothetical protein
VDDRLRVRNPKPPLQLLDARGSVVDEKSGERREDVVFSRIGHQGRTQERLL